MKAIQSGFILTALLAGFIQQADAQSEYVIRKVIDNTIGNFDVIFPWTDINDAGDVAFVAQRWSPASTIGVYIRRFSENGSLETILEIPRVEPDGSYHGFETPTWGGDGDTFLSFYHYQRQVHRQCWALLARVYSRQAEQLFL